MNIYPDQESWDQFNQNMSNLFDIEYETSKSPNVNYEHYTNNSNAWNKGLKLGEEWSNARKNYTFTDEQYEKVISHLNELRKTMYTKERSEKISKSLLGYKMTDERKKNISNTKKGKKYTLEQKAAKSEVMKKWHLNRKAHIHKVLSN